MEPSPEDEEEPADVLGLAPSSSTGLDCTRGAGEAASQYFWQGSRLFGRGARWLLAEYGFWG